MNLHGWVLAAERKLDAVRLRRAGTRPPAHFRIEPYIGHGGPAGVVVRGRVLDNQLGSEAEAGEGVRAAARRTLRHFVTNELPGVPLRITVAGTSVDAESDEEGYFLVRLATPAEALTSPWTTGTIELRGDYRGVTSAHARTSRCWCRPLALASASSPTSTTRSSRPACSGRCGWSSRPSPARPSRGRRSPGRPSSTATWPRA